MNSSSDANCSPARRSRESWARERGARFASTRITIPRPRQACHPSGVPDDFKNIAGRSVSRERPSFSASASDAVDLAARQIGKPYVWGAEGPNSFDCSGLTQYVYSEVGLDLPRRAVSQSTFGEPAGRQLQRG